MGSPNINTVTTSITGNDYRESKDILLFLQGDIKSLSDSFQSSENTAYSAVVKSTDYTAINSDYVILVNTAGGAISITLPTAVGRRGKQFIIKDWSGDAGANNITITPSSAQTIDEAASKTISANFGKFWIVSDNSNWLVLGT